MNLLRHMAAFASHGLNYACQGALTIAGAWRRKRKFLVVEQADDVFEVLPPNGRSSSGGRGEPLRFVDGRFVDGEGSRVRPRLAGADVEIVLATKRFMFRSLELPARASGFLDAIVRAQIDRLTPWSPTQAVFGCAAPAELAGGRVSVAIAATAHASVAPLVAAMEALAAQRIVVSTTLDDPNGPARSRISVFSQQTHRERQLRRLRRVMIAAPVLALLAGLSALAAWAFVDSDLEASRLRLAQLMAERRAALSTPSGGAAHEAAAALAERKRTTPASVIVLESLSQALPDDTHLTELQIADGKLQMSGVTHEAAALIRIMEQTSQFKRATFFAPTTMAAGEGGEQFHIEAQVAPYYPEVP
jgi:general secretion pathway protein L